MAHIFSFDPSPPHPSSPWNEQAEDDSAGTLSRRRKKSPLSSKLGTSSSGNAEAGEQKSGKGLVGTKGLISEPQVGATEYKLHLLKEGKSSIRLEQLTTQLLWRLQQSNPNFSNAPGGGSNKPQHIRDSLQDSQGALYELGVCDDGTLVGLLEEELEESLDTLRLMASRLGCAVWVLRKVAIGEVTPEDAARNSSENYRAGEWDDREDMGRRRGSKTGTLWVAEAFVKPIISKEDGEMGAGKSSSESAPGGFFKVKADIVPPATEQLKVSLTGTTTSGKSTLLGTLTSSQPDNGRGKSRLGLFRHRHELVSGVTSSVAQEILGYKPYSTVDYRGGEVINYSYGNISSWTDVHTAISNIHAVPDTDRNGRVVLLSDTAGHPRYRRTTIRSLVGWAPDYALLLIPGDEDELSDASKRHLQLVLKLGLRLVVLITKLDVARREGLRKVLGEVLTTLRQARREPQTLSSAEKNIGIWSDKEEQNVRKLIEKIEILDEEHPGAGGKVVPVVFISSVSGVGIGTLHALLRGLPIPKEGTRKETLDANDGDGLVPIEGSSLEEVMDGLGKVKVVEGDVDTGHMLANRDETGENQEHHMQPVETLFHIEEVYALPSTYTYFPEVTIGGAAPPKAPEGAIVSGHLRYGRISVGDELVVGPFNTRAVETGLASRGAEMTRSISTGSLPSKKKGTLDLSPSNSPFLLASSAGSFGKRGWLSDEEGTGVSSGDEQNRDAKFRRPRSALAKGGSLGRKLSGEVGDVGDAEEFQHHQQQKLQGEEWRVARVVSVRRLRLPVGTLFQGEAGTVGLVCLGVYKPSVVNPDDAKTPEITVETVAEEKEEDEEEGGVSLLADGGVSLGDKAIAITGGANKQEGGVVNNETPSGTTKVVSFATDNTITAISNNNAGATQPSTTTSSSEFRLRKGMVIINQTVPAWDKVNAKNKPEWPIAYNGFLTVFTSEDDDFTGVRSGEVTVSSLTIGTHVVVYCASIRAAARVVEVPGYSNNNNNTSELKGGLEISAGKERRKKSQPQEEIDVFGFDEDEDGSGVGEKEGEEDGESERKVFVGFEFLGGNEWVEVGAKVLVTSGQGRGLDGVVGRVARVGL